jgi:hypothetical protein
LQKSTTSNSFNISKKDHVTDSEVDVLCGAPQFDQFSWYITKILQIICNLSGYSDYGGQFDVVYVSL